MGEAAMLTNALKKGRPHTKLGILIANQASTGPTVSQAQDPG